MDYQVVVSASARSDLHDIVRYISLDAPATAISFGTFLVSKSKTLARFPELGREVPEFADPSIREIIVRSYRVIYRVTHSKHLIEIRFWHAARGAPQIET